MVHDEGGADRELGSELRVYIVGAFVVLEQGVVHGVVSESVLAG